MKITCGTDIIEIERIKQTMEDMEQAFKDRVFTEAEIQKTKISTLCRKICSQRSSI